MEALIPIVLMLIVAFTAYKAGEFKGRESLLKFGDLLMDSQGEKVEELSNLETDTDEQKAEFVKKMEQSNGFGEAIKIYLDFCSDLFGVKRT